MNKTLIYLKLNLKWNVCRLQYWQKREKILKHTLQQLHFKFQWLLNLSKAFFEFAFLCDFVSFPFRGSAFCSVKCKDHSARQKTVLVRILIILSSSAVSPHLIRIKLNHNMAMSLETWSILVLSDIAYFLENLKFEFVFTKPEFKQICFTGQSHSIFVTNDLLQVQKVLYQPVKLHNVWLQKISIPPPQRVIGNSEGEGGLKGQNF